MRLVSKDANPAHLPAAASLAASALDEEEASLLQQIEAHPTCMFEGSPFLKVSIISHKSRPISVRRNQAMQRSILGETSASWLLYEHIPFLERSCLGCN